MDSSAHSSSSSRVKDSFDLTGRVAVITGGAGLLGVRHAEAIAEMGGYPVLVDINSQAADTRAAEIGGRFGVQAMGLALDITRPEGVPEGLDTSMSNLERVTI